MPRLLTPLALALALVLAPAAAAQQPLEVVWERPALRVNAVAFSPDGRLVASGGTRQASNPSFNGRLNLWDAATGDTVAVQEGGSGAPRFGQVNDLAFSSDGLALASAHGTVGCLPNGGCYSIAPGLFTWAVPTLAYRSGGDSEHPTAAVDFAPDGGALAVGYFYDNEGVIRLQHPLTLDTLRVLPGHDAVTSGVRYSPTGDVLASFGDENVARLWDAGTGALLHTLDHTEPPYHIERPGSVAFSPDGRFVATGGTNSYEVHVKLWRVADGALVRTIDARPLDVLSYRSSALVAFSPNGRYVAAAVTQEYQPVAGQSVVLNRLRFWDVETGALAADYDAGTFGPGSTAGFDDLAMSAGQDHLFAFAFNRGVVVARTELNLASPVTAGEGGPGAGGYRLALGPNPSAAPALTLMVTEAQHVRAEAFDALGRRVAVLHDAPVAPGAVVRLALEAPGLAPGAYVVRVVGEAFTAARTLTVAR